MSSVEYWEEIVSTVEHLSHAETAIPAEYQCAMTHPEKGRCARTACEDHHIVRRSEGGSDEPDNVVFICHRHHAQIHARRKPWLKRIELDDGTWGFVERDLGREGPVWRLWPDVQEEFEQRALDADNWVDAGLRDLKDAAWTVAVALYELDRASLWPLLGSGCDNVSQYAQDKGVPPRTFRALLLAEKRRRKLPEQEQTRVLRLPIRLMEQIGKHLLEMEPAERDEIYTAVEAGAPTQDLIDDVRESSRYRDTADPRFEVTLQITAGSAVMEVTASDQEAAVSEVKKRVAGYKPLRGTVEWGTASVRKITAPTAETDSASEKTQP